MMREDGGRESGAESRSQADSSPSGGRPQAAANPAARELHPCPNCDPLHEQYRKRIRELEDRVHALERALESQDRLRRSAKANAVKAETHVKELEFALDKALHARESRIALEGDER